MVTNNSDNIPTAATGKVLQGAGVGTAPAFSTATYPATTTSQQILYSTAANTVGELTTANSKLPATNSSGTLAMRAFSINVQTFTSSGTYTPTSGMLYCIIECVGNGGGGGGTATASAANLSIGGGGGGGGYSRKFSSATTVGASQTITVGTTGAGGTSGNNAGTNGGDVSVGTICVGKGGTGGTGNSGSSSPAGGAGGVAGTGDYSIPGQKGGNGTATTVTQIQGSTGLGGNSLMGFNGGPTTSTPATGIAGQNYGAGGGGGSSFNANGAAAGGAGTTGLVVITEYVIA